ncbi:MAG: CHASE2 domain-containing protein [Gemmatimonadetes bacterium]|nr:CHASE2 domain-containing protein [Gemmatimonadota bacterium]
MPRTHAIPRRVLLTGAAAAVVVLTVAVAAPDALARLEERTLDGLMVSAGGRAPASRVTVVAVDDQSVAAIGQWPWPHDVMAQFVDSLNASGATVVAYDIMFSEPDRTAGAASASQAQHPNPHDSALARAFSRGPTILGAGFTFGRASTDDHSACVLHPAPVVQVGDALSPAAVFHPTGAVCALPLFGRSVGATGFLNAGADGDGVLRRVPLLMAFEGRLHPSLALQAVAIGASGPLQVLEARDGRLVLRTKVGEVRLDPRATVRVRFRGPGQTFTHVSAADVLRGRVPPGALRGHVVFVGVTGLGLRDVVATPFDPAYPGVEVHATLAADLLDGTTLWSPYASRTIWLLATLAFGMAAAVLVARAGLALGAVGSLVAVGALWGAALWSMRGPGVVFTPLYPTLAVALALAALTVLSLRHEGNRADVAQVRREQTRDFAVSSLTSLVETRDRSTGLHAKRTGEFVALIATQLNAMPRYRGQLDADYVRLLARLAVLHDIGKVGIPDAVLNKADKLTDDEYAQMKRHPELGYETIVRAERDAGLTDGEEADVLRLAKDLVRTHHERWDGKGYPHGLAGEAIPLPGRIMAVVDVYDALVQARVYRGALSHEVAVSHIAEGRGTAFDPDVVDAFHAVEAQFKALTTRFEAEAALPGRS